MGSGDDVLDRLRGSIGRLSSDAGDVERYLREAMQEFPGDPATVLFRSRMAFEALVPLLIKRYDIEQPAGKGQTAGALLDHLRSGCKKNSSPLPKLEDVHMGTVVGYGNLGCHHQPAAGGSEASRHADNHHRPPSDAENRKLLDCAVIALKAWRCLLDWYEAEFIRPGSLGLDGPIGKHLRDECGLKPIRWANLALNRRGKRIQATSARFRACVPCADGGIAWQAGDAVFPFWEPVGLCGVHDADQGREALLVAWRGRGLYRSKGIRLTVVNTTAGQPLRYRHVLLVTEALKDSKRVFQALPTSTCSMVTVGSTLLVADGTSAKLRVFDTDSLFRCAGSPGKKRVGVWAHGVYAFDYRYLLPQSGELELEGGVVPEALGTSQGGNDEADIVIAGRTPDRVAQVRTYRLDGMALKRVCDLTAGKGLPVDGAVRGVACHGGELILLAGDRRPRLLAIQRADDSPGLSAAAPRCIGNWPRCTAGLYFPEHRPEVFWTLTASAGRRLMVKVNVERLEPAPA